MLESQLYNESFLEDYYTIRLKWFCQLSLKYVTIC